MKHTRFAIRNNDNNSNNNEGREETNVAPVEAAPATDTAPVAEENAEPATAAE